MHSELSRSLQDNPGVELSKVLTDQVLQILNETFSKELETRELKIEVKGFTYPKELLMIATLVNTNQELNQSPLHSNFLASCDLPADAKQELVLTFFKKSIDALGHCLDDYFSTEDWSEYYDFWQELKMGKTLFYVKSNRENIEHTLLADQILRASQLATF